MNSRIFRLVFDRLRNALVPVSEVARAATVSSASRGRRRAASRSGAKHAARAATAAALLALAFVPAGPAISNEPLPVPAANFVSSGAATQAVAGATMTINQASDRAILNWQSFNIDANHLVQFNQPGASSIALNRIGSADPSIIAGALRANGQIYLFNQNGILFAQGAQINVGGLVATTLNITDDVFQKGILSITDGSPAFAWDGTASQFGNSFVRLDPGANIRTADGGRVMLFAPRVENAGRIETPGGQAILAAGARVYLEASTDARLRGLLVEVDPLSATQRGTVTNQNVAGAVGEIIAQRGNVTLMGFAVNQNGRITATSSVSANGSVYLLARDDTTTRSSPGDPRVARVARQAGNLVLGAGSITDVSPDRTSNETSIDAQTFNPSSVVLQANKVYLQGGSTVRATGGDISITALKDPSNPVGNVARAPANGSRIFMDADAVVDASGSLGVEIPVERNIVTAELRGNELRDAPLQRGGVLQGRKVLVDSRVGTSLADVSGYLAQTRRGIGERTAAGGTVTFLSEGDVVIREGAVVDVSGGSIQWLAGVTGTTKLVSNGQIFDIGKARPDAIYQSAFDGTPQLEAGYVEGKDAGTVRLSARALVLDGTLHGSAISGAGQTDPASAPKGGRLVLGDQTGGSSGQDLRLPSILVTPGVGSLSTAFLADPMNASLGDRASKVTVALPAMVRNGFDRVGLYSNDVVQLPTDLTLRPGGSFVVNARRVELTGNLNVPAGEIALESVVTENAGVGGVSVAAGRTLSVAGRWVNDWLDTSAGVGRTAAWIDGGVIRINSNTGISIGNGAVLDASGGARLKSDRKADYGDGGSIDLKTNVGSATITSLLDLGGQLKAFGFDQGGKLSISVPKARIGGTALAGELGLAPEFFQSGGFGDITIDAVTGMTVADGTIVSPRLANLVLRTDAASIATGAPIYQVAAQSVLPSELRNPASITLRASDIVDGRTVLGAGAAIVADPGSVVTLSAGAQLTVLGSITAPAGTIALSISSRAGQSLDPGFLDGQSLWIGAESRLSVAGVADVITDARGLRNGSALGGGTISAIAGRGYLVVQDGAVLDVRGASAVLDVAANGALGSLFVPRMVYSDAGRIILDSRESVLFDGTVRATPGGASAAGGRFELTLDRRQLINLDPPYPLNERVIELRAAGLAVPAGLRPGDAIDRSANNGIARVSVDRLAGAGLDDLVFKTEGRIRFAGDVTLSAGRSIALDAPILEGLPGAKAIVEAPYLAIENLNPVLQGAKAGSVGTATFMARGNLIDVAGAVGLRGFDSVTLESATDLRLRGVLDNSLRADRLSGSLTGRGDLLLRAQQVYPTTLSEFTIDYSGDNASLVRFERASGAAAGTPLSAGGNLVVKASTIEQAGVVRAPVGSIAFEATQVTLASGSETSVSARGLLIPFGKVENGKDWIYDFRNGISRTFDRPADKAISLNGASVVVDGGATVDLSGGGDLFAYEFVPGLGGSADYLAKPGVYAVLPGLTTRYAPFDQQYSTISNLKPGDSITLGAGGGLAAGTYTLLPGHYALLPGAFAVSLVNGYQDIGPSQGIALANGGAIVSGTRFAADSGAAQQRSAGYLVESSGLVRQRAEYDGFLASDFFRAAAVRDGNVVPRLPSDAGQLVAAASGSLLLDGIVNLAAGVNGRGGLLDIVADRIAVVGSGAPVPAGYLAVRAGEITRIGAESVLIGGTRTQDSRGTRITTRSSQIVVDNDGTPLAAGELMMVASGRITLAAKSTVSASGNAVPYPASARLLVAGDGAFVRVSSDSELRLERSGTARVAGLVEVGSAVVFAGNAVELDGTLDTRVASDVVIDSASVGLGASRVIFGPASAGTGSGLTVDATLLAQLADARTLLFRGYDSIDFSESLTLGGLGPQGQATLQRLVLDSPSLRGQGDANSIVKLTAGAIELRNTSGVMAGAAGTGLGTLELMAASSGTTGGQLLLDAGTKSVSGFASNTLTAARDILLQGTGSIAVSGKLDLVAQRLTAATAARQSVDASGALTVTAAGTLSSGNTSTGLGANVSLSGASVAFGGLLDLASGVATIRATEGDVTLSNGGMIRTGGVTRTFDGVGVHTHGGDITLVADAGSVILGAGSALDVSAPAAGGNGGAITIRAGDRIVVEPADAVAPVAALSGRATAGRGGRFLSQSGFSSYTGTGDGEGAAVVRLLDALAPGGFEDVRIGVGRGDLVLQTIPGSAIAVRGLSVSADGGAIELLSSIEASGTKEPRVSLWARDDVLIGSGVRISARANTAGAKGGTVELGSAEGWVRLGQDSGFDVSGGNGGAGGTVRLRVPRTEGGAGNAVQLVTNNASVTGATDVIVEAVRTYSSVSSLSQGGGVGALSIDTVNADVAQFMQSADAIRQSYAGLVTRLRPGVEVRSTGDLALDAAWDLFSSTRPGNEPGFLTLRAAGDLHLNASLTDGFEGGSLQSGDSWTYRLVAGAEMGAADPLRVQAAGGSGGDVVVAADTMVRTGTGAIEVAARRDFKLSSETSVLYTAGRASAPAPDFIVPEGAAYPEDGGRLTIAAGRDVLGVSTRQLVTNWNFRQGTTIVDPVTGKLVFDQGTNTTWYVRFDRFRQNIGALGGGDVSVSAGRDIQDLSVMLPTTGRISAAFDEQPSASRLLVLGGGDLDVRAGRDIAGGQYFVARGEGALQAGGSLTLGKPAAAGVSAFYPILAAADSRFAVSAVGDLNLETVFNPTVAAAPVASFYEDSRYFSYFFTYSQPAGVRLMSLAGDVTVHGRTSQIAAVTAGGPRDDQLIFVGPFEESALAVFPGSLKIAALSKGVDINAALSLFPSARGELEIFAANDIVTAGTVTMSDLDPALLPGPATPRNFITQATTALFASPLASISHGLSLLHAGDPNPARLVSLTGDIVGNSLGTGAVSAKSARVIAGRDIVDFFVAAQNLAASEVTLVQAGRDVRYSVARIERTNQLTSNFAQIVVGGPGRVDVIAGRDVDLGTSVGFQTVGNLANPALPESGAGLRVLAGTDTRLDANRFLADFPGIAAEAGADLAQRVREFISQPGLSQQQAFEAFRSLPASDQKTIATQVAGNEFYRRYLQPEGSAGVTRSYRTEWVAFASASGVDPDAPSLDVIQAFRYSVLWAELRASGRAAVAGGATPNDYSRGYDAISLAGLGGAFESTGDINLIFSQVKTQRGGEIELLAPTGSANVGLSTPPAGFSKGADSLGILSVRGGDVNALVGKDFNVNQSRVFTLEGGNILVWSSEGNIDAGRGAKTAISVPPPVVRINSSGELVVEFPGAASGSGIGVLLTRPDLVPGDVDLIAPTGTVNAGDAGIRAAGNLTIAAVRVVGADNIQVGGTSAGVPAQTSSIGAGVSLGNVGSEGQKAAEKATQNLEKDSSTLNKKSLIPSFITVEVLGIGEDDRDYQSEVKKCENLSPGDKQGCLSSARKNRGQI